MDKQIGKIWQAIQYREKNLTKNGRYGSLLIMVGRKWLWPWWTKSAGKNNMDRHQCKAIE
jgi:hypothetical protein